MRDDLPPLPAKRRDFFCTRCGSQQCKPGSEMEPHPPCAKCPYLGFGADAPWSDDDMHAYARAVIAERDAEIVRLIRELESHRIYARVLRKAVDAATDFAGTVAGGASWWDEVWADHAEALDKARSGLNHASAEGIAVRERADE